MHPLGKKIYFTPQYARDSYEGKEKKNMLTLYTDQTPLRFGRLNCWGEPWKASEHPQVTRNVCWLQEAPSLAPNGK